MLLAYVVYNLWLSALIEPGILPRNEPTVKPQLPPGAETTGNNGWKFCESCNIYRYRSFLTLTAPLSWRLLPLSARDNFPTPFPAMHNNLNC